MQLEKNPSQTTKINKFHSKSKEKTEIFLSKISFICKKNKKQKPLFHDTFSFLEQRIRAGRAGKEIKTNTFFFLKCEKIFYSMTLKI
jgi:hypothetical protein